MARLFQPVRIRQLTLANRFVRSATWLGLADADGRCSPELIDRMAALAQGGVGLIISGHAYVQPEGQATLRQLGIGTEAQRDALFPLSEAVHREGGRIFLQLAHGGLQADPGLTGRERVGPSTGQGLVDPPGRPMTTEEIRNTVTAFARAAGWARAADFDGVQIHAAHGYLLSQFLSPAFNTREDEYGGSMENRARFLIEVLDAVRREVGRYYPVLVKINSADFLEGGFEEAGFLWMAQRLAHADGIEVSGGTGLSGAKSPFRRGIGTEREQAYFRRAARALKKKTAAAVILVGGIRSFFVAERMLGEGYADYVALSRPLIREPNLVGRWRSGDLRKAACISCNGCLGPGLKGKGVFCVQERAQ